MEASTSTTPRTSEATAGKPTPVNGGADVGRDGLTDELRAARENEILSPEAEFSALQFLLGPVEAIQFDVPVHVDTPAGRKTVTFRIAQLDPTTLERLDSEARNGETTLARIDQAKFVAHVVAESGVSMSDETGAEVSFSSREWIISAPQREGYTTKASALTRAFKFNGGVLEALASRIQEVSGFEAERVGVASRVLTEAAKGL